MIRISVRQWLGPAVFAVLAAASGGAYADVACVQSKLTELGFEPGPADGQIGKRTRNAAELFAAGSGLSLSQFSAETSAEWCEALTTFSGKPQAGGVAASSKAALRAKPTDNHGFGPWSWIGVRRGYSYQQLPTLPEGAKPRDVDGAFLERFEIRAGDCGKDGDYNQCEHDREHIGWNEERTTPLDQEVWYSFSLMAPVNPAMGEVNTILAEWRPDGPGQINFSLELQGGRLAAIVGATEVEQEDDMEPPPIAKWGGLDYLVPGTWYDYQLQAVFSRNPQKGKILLIKDGKVVFYYLGTNTAFDRPVHMQYGIYRPFTSKNGGDGLPTQIVYFDNVHKADSKAALGRN